MDSRRSHVIKSPVIQVPYLYFVFVCCFCLLPKKVEQKVELQAKKVELRYLKATAGYDRQSPKKSDISRFFGYKPRQENASQNRLGNNS